MGEPITLVVTVTMPNGYLATLRNIGAEAAEYVADQLRAAGVAEPAVTCLVGKSQTTSASFSPPAGRGDR